MVLKDHVISLDPQMLVADVQVAQSLGHARLELDGDQPPAVIVEPDSRSTPLRDAKWPENLASDDADQIATGNVHERRLSHVDAGVCVGRFVYTTAVMASRDVTA
jgi:hypothetical protein